MKRKNLFLSLISSVVVAIAIITVTVCTVIKPKNNNNNPSNPGADNINIVDNSKKYDLENEYNRNGSEEYPYIIYSAESFNKLLSQFGGEQRTITRPVTEEVEVDGEMKIQNKLDADGHLIFEKVLDDEGNETYGVYNFEFANDIDFTGVEYITLFNEGKAFIGNINGNGYALKNVAINVTTENLESKFSYTEAGNRYAHIALFGEISGSTLKNMTISSLSVNVASDVNGFISGALYDFAGGQFVEMFVAGVAGIANDATLSNVTLDAAVSGSAYYVSIETNDNAMGGVAAVAKNLTVENSKINVTIAANAGSEYLVGGIAAYGRGAKVTSSEVNVAIETSYSRRLSMAGMFAYAKALEVSDSSVNFTLTETASQESRNSYVESLTKDADGNDITAEAGKMSTAAGIVCIIRANDSTQKTVISNVTVKSTVNFDCIYAGAILDVYSKDPTTKDLVKLSDIVVDVNANVLALHAFARQLVATTVSYTAEKIAVEGYYNIKVAGSAKLANYSSKIDATTSVSRGGATIFTAVDRKYIDYSFKDLFIQVTAEADAEFKAGFDKFSIAIGAFGGYEIIG